MSAISAGSRSSQRGASLLEGVLYLALVASVIVFAVNFIAEEQRRQDEVALANEYRIALEAAQSYLMASYRDEIDELFAAAGDPANTTGEALRSITMAELAADGHIPAIFASGQGALQRLHGQEFRLLTRAVLRGGGATLVADEMDPPPSSGSVDADLVDGDPDNGEIDIEAILVSTGGAPIPPQTAAPVVVRTERANAGFVREGTDSEGPYGLFAFDVTPYLSLAPDLEGRFAGIAALSNFGVLNATGISEDPEDDDEISDAFRRCAAILADDGYNTGSPIYEECLLSDNVVYGPMVFAAYDDSTGGRVAPEIRGLQRLDMLVDANNDGVPDVLSAIENVARIGCGTGQAQPVANSLLIDCLETRLTGDLDVAGAVAASSYRVFDGTAERDLAAVRGVDGVPEVQVSADRVLLSSLGGVDAASGIYDVRVIASGDSVPEPTCPARTADDTAAMAAEIYAVPISYADASARANMGLQVLPVRDGTDWRVFLFQYVAEDRCTYNIASFDPDEPDTYPPGTDCADNPDGVPDLVEVDGTLGAMLAMTRCAPVTP